MDYANKINDLVVKFIRLELEGSNQILVMERLNILEPRSIEIEIRDVMYNVFIEKLKELHKHGFCHRDIKHPSGFGGRTFDNVVVTDLGIRLIDVSISALKELTGEELFEHYVNAELEEVKEYYNFLMEL